MLAGAVDEVLRRCLWLLNVRSPVPLLLQGVPGSCCHGCAGNAGNRRDGGGKLPGKSGCGGTRGL